MKIALPWRSPYTFCIKNGTDIAAALPLNPPVMHMIYASDGVNLRPSMRLRSSVGMRAS